MIGYRREQEFAKFYEDPCIDIAAFKVFLAAQPPDKKYDYGDPCNCPLARYLQSIGEPAYARNGMCFSKSLRAARYASPNDS